MWACAKRREPSPLAWHRCHQRWFGQKFLFGEAINLAAKKPWRCSTRSPTRGRLSLRRRSTRASAASVVINGRMYVCGGRSGDPDSPSAFLDCFDPVSGIWQILPPMSQGRLRHAAAVVGGRLYVCGGWDSDRDALESAECFDTLTSSWQSLPAMLHPHYEGHAAVIKNHVYIIGGDTNRLASERLPPTGNWQELPRMSRPRLGFATAVVADRLHVCGGHR